MTTANKLSAGSDTLNSMILYPFFPSLHSFCLDVCNLTLLIVLTSSHTFFPHRSYYMKDFKKCAWIFVLFSLLKLHPLHQSFLPKEWPLGKGQRTYKRPRQLNLRIVVSCILKRSRIIASKAPIKGY